MYSFDSRVSFSMVDADQNITLNSIINYFQDASTYHSEDVGMGYAYLIPRKLVWVINTWQVDIIRYPKYLEKIRIVTIPYRFRGFLGYRCCYIENEAGEILVKANALWSLINFETMKPTNAPEGMAEAYSPGQMIDMDIVSGKIRMSENQTKHKTITVEPHFLDPNKHMNNGEYIKLAMSYLPENFKISRLRAEYRNQAFLGYELFPVSSQCEDGKWVVSINDKDGKPYSVLEFTGTAE